MRRIDSAPWTSEILAQNHWRISDFYHISKLQVCKKASVISEVFAVPGANFVCSGQIAPAGTAWGKTRKSGQIPEEARFYPPYIEQKYHFVQLWKEAIRGPSRSGQIPNHYESSASTLRFAVLYAAQLLTQLLLAHTSTVWDRTNHHSNEGQRNIDDVISNQNGSLSSSPDNRSVSAARLLSFSAITLTRVLNVEKHQSQLPKIAFEAHTYKHR